ncbi:hypothetical protein AVEN_116063-1 [Araneus ventricosus]|uniref:Uncharacterized protein n=1 Tax=Araneus ventricosus TaxID=182803 RepID=A0A4Y2QYE1_ARAVE|nr:hypothetical protein AVEN_116063-1 [Araneus ventricosus]
MFLELSEHVKVADRTTNGYSQILCSVCDAHSAIAENNAFHPMHHVGCACLPLSAFLAFPHRLCLCDHLRNAGIISYWLDLTLHVANILPMPYYESPYS